MNETTALKEENALLKAQLTSKNEYIRQLEEAMVLMRQRQFGSSSEKHNADQLQLFDEAEQVAHEESSSEEESTIEVQTHERKKRARVSIPESLPREIIEYDLPQEEKVCPNDGTVLKEIGHETHEQLDIIPAQVKVLRHLRRKYACPCCEQYVAVAKKPKQPIEKSIASPGLLAYVTTAKFCDAAPLYRQSKIFERIGIDISRANLSNWMIRCADLVQPLINLLKEKCLEQSVIHLDETSVQVLKEPEKAAQSKSYMWVMAIRDKQPIVLFNYAPSRSQVVPLELLEGINKDQAIMTDGYEGYQKACDDYELTRLGCWAHARRKFVDAQKVHKSAVNGKGKTGKADQAIAFIKKLYLIEKEIKDKPIDERYRIRQTKSKPIIEKIEKWLEKSLLHAPPKTALGKALGYLHSQWDRLILYLNNGAYPIDNNHAENAIRPFVIGRKNWLFSNSQAGANASANLYSLVETAKANGLNPYEYLKLIFKELPNAESVDAIECLMPWYCKDNGLAR